MYTFASALAASYKPVACTPNWRVTNTFTRYSEVVVNTPAPTNASPNRNMARLKRRLSAHEKGTGTTNTRLAYHHETRMVAPATPST